MVQEAKWPSIQSTVEDKEIMNAIRKHNGKLRGIEQKDLLLIAASIAVKNDLPYDSRIESKKTDTISYANLRNSDYRHYISAIYFLTKANKNLDNIKDTTDIVKNFEDYAHRGILYLQDNYLNNRDGDNEQFENFVDLLGKITENKSQS